MLKREMLVNLVMLALSFFMLSKIRNLPEPPNTVELGPGFFPELIVYILIIFNTIQIIILFFKKTKDTEEERVNIGNLVIMIVLMAVYVFSLSIIDYKIGTFFFILFVMILLGVKNYKKLLLVTSLSTASIFLLFEVILNVPIN